MQHSASGLVCVYNRKVGHAAFRKRIGLRDNRKVGHAAFASRLSESRFTSAEKILWAKNGRKLVSECERSSPGGPVNVHEGDCLTSAFR